MEGGGIYKGRDRDNFIFEIVFFSGLGTPPVRPVQ